MDKFYTILFTTILLQFLLLLIFRLDWDIQQLNILSEIQSVNEIFWDQLPQDDRGKLIDLKEFHFTINLKSCVMRKLQPLVLVLIHSAPGNWLKRATIRETWGREDSRSRIIFLLGAVNSAELQRKLEQENRLYEDMVQGNFFDSYQNMTYKHVMALKWFTYYCPEAKYILKTDDNIFLNSPAVYKYLEKLSINKKLIFCSTITGKVPRNPKSKWYVSEQEYPEKYFPLHCLGYAIIYSADAAFLIYKEAQTIPYFWMDNFHLTRTVAQKVNLNITEINSQLVLQSEAVFDIAKGRKFMPSNFLFIRETYNENILLILWKILNFSFRKIVQ